MPNRIIREGLIDSPKINQLDAHAERFFFRLMLKADDFGRYHADPVALKNTLYPLKDDIRATDSARFLTACEVAGLVRCYETAKGRFLEIVDFKQQRRSNQSKYPSPEEGLAKDAKQVPSECAADATQTHSKCSLSAYAYSEAETKSKAETGPTAPPKQFAEAPSWEEWWEYAQRIGYPAEWHARDKFLAQEAKGWGGCIWRKLCERCRGWWEADGRPMHPRGATRPAGREDKTVQETLKVKVL